MGSAYSATLNTNINEQSYEVSDIQKYAALCSASCSNDMDNNTYVISGKINGDVNISQTCKGNANCIVQQQLDAIAQQTATNSTSNTNQSGLPKFFSLDANTVSNVTAVKSKLEQYVNNECRTVVSNLSKNSTFIVRSDADISGNVNISQNGDAAAQCAMVTAAKLQSIANGVNTSTASNGSVSAGAATTLIILGIVFFIVAAVAIFIFVSVYFGPELGALSKFGKVASASGSSSGGGQQDPMALLSMMK